MVVDIPANTRDAAGNVIKGPKATKALYPDDPSNVYHSYIGDHTKFTDSARWSQGTPHTSPARAPVGAHR